MDEIREKASLDIFSDCHVHCGQYYDVYYQPATVIKTLHDSGIKKVWISSTTSCLPWETEDEKKYLVEHIDDEIEEAVYVANEYGMEITPLYWVLIQRYTDGESIESIMKDSLYRGFKIHPKVGEWSEDNVVTDKLMKEVCEYASVHGMPILIHTGYDELDSPGRFEHYFKKYGNVKFVLAHCKALDKIIDVFRSCRNVYGDMAFCPEENYEKICLAGFADRMQCGTDFPITHWTNCGGLSNSASEHELLMNYKSTIKEKISFVGTEK